MLHWKLLDENFRAWSINITRISQNSICWAIHLLNYPLFRMGLKMARGGIFLHVFIPDQQSCFVPSFAIIFKDDY